MGQSGLNLEQSQTVNTFAQLNMFELDLSFSPERGFMVNPQPPHSHMPVAFLEIPGMMSPTSLDRLPQGWKNRAVLDNPVLAAIDNDYRLLGLANAFAN